MSEKVAVIGAGSWGTTLAILLADKGHEVTLWAFEPELVREIETKRENTLFLPGISIPAEVVPTHSLEEAVRGKSVIVSVVPSHVVRQITLHYGEYLSEGVHLVSASKGLEEGSLLRMSQVIQQSISSDRQIKLSCLSGPSFAREVAKKMATAVAVACQDEQEAIYIQHLFSSCYFRVYRNSDLIGVELAGSLKNVIAIAAGISDGLGFGYNARAALITRGLVEISRLGIALGARPETFYGLAGMGDLILTCTADLSRNRSLGLRIGRGEKLSDIQTGMKMVAEGVNTTRAALRLAREFQVEMPIAEQVSAILFEGRPPLDAFSELMSRTLKYE
ncbi:MAG: NAD(P)-dependent glycerol-3-phosphate dehydrogenase [bacterium]|nr:NAD(P)-dependent glycerol-3-phosphate dehydrogenase [bacterium]